MTEVGQLVMDKLIETRPEAAQFQHKGFKFWDHMNQFVPPDKVRGNNAHHAGSFSMLSQSSMSITSMLPQPPFTPPIQHYQSHQLQSTQAASQFTFVQYQTETTDCKPVNTSPALFPRCHMAAATPITANTIAAYFGTFASPANPSHVTMTPSASFVSLQVPRQSLPLEPPPVPSERFHHPGMWSYHLTLTYLCFPLLPVFPTSVIPTCMPTLESDFTFFLP
ncbi:hypothetical protein EV401DRAFT_2081184 [Pisolithus croceorrhizus]|nr:hypothetical protein EV401DRAFT_2081184 [Pisolithus croceorrhizus]